MGRHPDATIDALTLNAIGHVPWWPPDQNEVSLHHVLVRVATDTSRHAGQADIIRELIVGTVGLTKESTSMPPGDRAWWRSHRDQVEHAPGKLPRPSATLRVVRRAEDVLPAR